MTKKNKEVFMEITNLDIYKKLEEVCNHVKTTNSNVAMNRKWLVVLTSAFGIGFIFVLTLLYG